MQSSIRATVQKGVTRQFFKQQVRSVSSVNNPADAVFSGANAQYIDSMFQKWKVDPSTVHASWDSFFKVGGYAAPGIVPNVAVSSSTNIGTSTSSSAPSGAVDASVGNVVQLCMAFQRTGHNIANLDPLGLAKERGTSNEDLTPAFYGLTDLTKVYDLSPFKKILGSIATKGPLTLEQIVQYCKSTYSSTVGLEFSHVATQAEVDFFRTKAEAFTSKFDKEYKKRVLTRLTYATQFESFLKSKYNVKRFGIEGNESTIVALREILRVGSESGIESTVFGMPHRGRLNILVNVVGKPLEVMFSEFAGNNDGDVALEKNADGIFGTSQDVYAMSSDVKYHHGWSAINELDNGKTMHCTLLPNPSHLETVNPVSQGKTRAKQHFIKDKNGSKVLNIQLHGDAAFAGQGVVFESLAMQGLQDYTVGGTIHVVVNNQIGFTTNPDKSRSGPYCTDVAKSFQMPIIHVNAVDVEAVARAAKLAIDYRTEFKKDIVLDIIGWRLNGHNELDQPSFTQPLMYKKIAETPTILTQYQTSLIQEGALTQAEADEVLLKVDTFMREKFDESRTYTAKPNHGQFLTKQWSKIADAYTPYTEEDTGVALEELKNYGKTISTIPEDIVLHRGIGNAYRDKKAAIENGEGFDWATAEALAFASLLNEGFPVRIAGQDAERGTFSHRHAVVHDQNTDKLYVPLDNLENKEAAKFTVVNSLLSEYGALGFEYGYSLENPDQLVLWEGQFGDFVNGCQIILDNYIASAEYKWNRQSGLVMLLPHGMEGQGPEHSNAYPLRFLQSVNDDPHFFPRTPEEKKAYTQRNNWQVLNMTSSANYFHALRRQVKRNIRKPMIVMSPKSLLRHRGAASSYEDLVSGTAFKPVLGDAAITDNNMVKRHVLCSGKVYFDIIDQLEKAGVRDQVAVTRIEQLAPFPFEEVEKEDAKYQNADIVFVQEEHMNFGPYTYLAPRIATAVERNRDIVQVPYVGRPPAAAPACGASKIHSAELSNFLADIIKF